MDAAFGEPFRAPSSTGFCRWLALCHAPHDVINLGRLTPPLTNEHANQPQLLSLQLIV